MAQQARHDEYGDVVVADGCLGLVTMEMALKSWSAVDCRCSGGILVFFLLPARRNAHPVRFNQLIFYLLSRVPPKFAESIMLNVFQTKTGQKFPRTPLPVFEVIQELRKVSAHFRFPFLLKLHRTSWTKAFFQCYAGLHHSVLKAGLALSCYPSTRGATKHFGEKRPLIGVFLLIHASVTRCFRTLRACSLKSGAPTNRECAALFNAAELVLRDPGINSRVRKILPIFREMQQINL